MVFTPTTTSTTQLIVTPPTTVMAAGLNGDTSHDHRYTNWQEWGYKSVQECVDQEGLQEYAKQICKAEPRY